MPFGLSGRYWGRITDELDRQIIEILQRDGRASHAEMAREMDVSEGTIRRRLARLIQDHVIRVVAIAEPHRLGYNTSAFIGLQVDPPRVETVASQLAALPETEHVAITTGTFDIFIWVNVASSEALAAFLHHKVGTVEGVRQSETFVSLATRKRGGGPGVP
ncbi:MAG: Lrp/AsnC family transcriptional regulator [Dehalococcoidia bacterium]